MFTRKRRLGQRILRLGFQGEDVRLLQEALQRMGHDVGEADGIYGYLTWEAVRQLQRDYGLRVDGVVGREVVRLIEEFQPELSTITYVVKEGDNLFDLARKFEMTSEALLATCRVTRRQITPGRRLVIHPRVVVGECLPGADNEVKLSLSQNHRLISSLVFSHFTFTKAGTIEGTVPDSLLKLCKHHGIPAVAGITNTGSDSINPAALSRRRTRKKITEEASRLFASGYGGLNLDIGYVPGALLGSVLSLIRELAKAARVRNAKLFVTIDDQVFGDKDGGRPRWSCTLLEDLGRIADWIIVRPFPIDTALSGDKVPMPMARAAGAIAVLRKSIPAWKLILAVPVNSLDLTAGKDPTVPASSEPLAYDKARALAYRKRSAIQWDEDSQAAWFAYTENGQEHKVWLENRSSFAPKAALVNSFRCGGLFLSRLGCEDRRIWDTVQASFKVAK